MTNLERFEALGARGILALAIAMEKRNAAAYAALAGEIGASCPPASTLLRELADEELEHMDALEAMWRVHFGDAAPPEVGDVDSELIPELLELDAPPEAVGEEEVLEAVRQAEGAAAEFYAEAARVVRSDDIRQLCSKLAAIESGHFARARAD